MSLQNFDGAPWTRPANQIWVGSYFESPEHYGKVEDPNIIANFNLTMGFRPDAAFPVFNMVYDTFKDFSDLANVTIPSWKDKQAQDTAMMSVWISNCGIDKTRRRSILEKLASFGILYASYGGCHNTHSPTQALSGLKNEGWRRYGFRHAGAEL